MAVLRPPIFSRVSLDGLSAQKRDYSVVYVCPCGKAMSGIVKVIVSFFRKGEEVAIERHRSRIPVDKETHKGVSELKQTS